MPYFVYITSSPQSYYWLAPWSSPRHNMSEIPFLASSAGSRLMLSTHFAGSAQHSQCQMPSNDRWEKLIIWSRKKNTKICHFLSTTDNRWFRSRPSQEFRECTKIFLHGAHSCFSCCYILCRCYVMQQCTKLISSDPRRQTHIIQCLVCLICESYKNFECHHKSISMLWKFLYSHDVHT